MSNEGSKLADQVRDLALQKYVRPARIAGLAEFSIAVRGLLEDLKKTDFPLNYTPLVCNAIKTKTFQRENHLEITQIEGPRSQTGTRVVVHYRVMNPEDADATSGKRGGAVQSENPRDRARRLTNGLKGLLKQEITQCGGPEAFIRWVRSEEEAIA